MGLIEVVRNKSGAGTADATDQAIADHLHNSRVQINSAAIEYHSDYVGVGTTTYTRADVPVSPYTVEAGTAGAGSLSIDAVVLRDGLGTVKTGWTMANDGRVVFDADTAGTAYYATGYAYDVYRASSLLVEDMVAASARDYDFKRGDQSFNRSQRTEGLLVLLKSLRRKVVPRRRGEVVMRDQNGAG